MLLADFLRLTRDGYLRLLSSTFYDLPPCIHGLADHRRPDMNIIIKVAAYPLTYLTNYTIMKFNQAFKIH